MGREPRRPPQDGDHGNGGGHVRGAQQRERGQGGLLLPPPAGLPLAGPHHLERRARLAGRPLGLPRRGSLHPGRQRRERRLAAPVVSVDVPAERVRRRARHGGARQHGGGRRRRVLLHRGKRRNGVHEARHAHGQRLVPVRRGRGRPFPGRREGPGRPARAGRHVPLLRNEYVRAARCGGCGHDARLPHERDVRRGRHSRVGSGDAESVVHGRRRGGAHERIPRREGCAPEPRAQPRLADVRRGRFVRHGGVRQLLHAEGGGTPRARRRDGGGGAGRADRRGRRGGERGRCGGRRGRRGGRDIRPAARRRRGHARVHEDGRGDAGARPCRADLLGCDDGRRGHPAPRRRSALLAFARLLVRRLA